MNEQIASIINSLADGLGVAASEVYRVMLAQAGTQIVKDLFSAPLCAAVLVFCWIFTKKVFLDRDEGGKTIIGKAEYLVENSCVACIFLSIGVAVLSVIMACVLIGYVREIIQCVMNPEYWAISEIIRLLTGA